MAPSLLVYDQISDASAIDKIQDGLNQSWRQRSDVPESVRNSVAIAAGEIAANIIEYAGRGGPVRIRVELQVLSDRVSLLFTDDGGPADVDIESAQMPDVFAERGRGLALARAELSELTYRRSAAGNQWTLVSRPFD